MTAFMTLLLVLLVHVPTRDAGETVTAGFAVGAICDGARNSDFVAVVILKTLLLPSA
jgi:hypothetical protein